MYKTLRRRHCEWSEATLRPLRETSLRDIKRTTLHGKTNCPLQKIYHTYLSMLSC
jgi:hypothetical protein